MEIALALYLILIAPDVPTMEPCEVAIQRINKRRPELNIDGKCQIIKEIHGNKKR